MAIACGEDADVDRASPAGPIPGDPAAPVAGAIPALEFDAAGSSYRNDHPQLPGLGISTDTALLVFRLETTIAEANQVLASEHAVVVGGLPGVDGAASGVLVIRLPTTTHAAMDTAILRLKSEKVVEHVVADTLVEGQAIPKPNGGEPAAWTWEDEPMGPNWGHEAIRMPQVWNLNDAVARTGNKTAVWVFDVGFDATHPDLAGAVPLNKPTVDPHGTHVAGTVGATFDDGFGVDGLNPFANLGLRGNRSVGEVAMTLNQVAEALTLTGNVPIVNISLGYNWYKYEPPIQPALQLPAQGVAFDGGRVFLSAMQALEKKGALPLVIVSAGNSSGPPLGDVDARYNSPWATAGIQFGAANVIVVEGSTNADPPGRYVHSNFGGHVSAPGVNVWSASVGPPDGNPYVAGAGPRFEGMDGTSMAAPHVAGVASYLLAFDPNIQRPTLEKNLVRDLLQSRATPAQGVASRIDAFATIVAANPERALRFLADVDDGTVDGNDRTTQDDARGDGKVDMRDFRRLRDWLLLLEQPADLDLDGPADHPKLDLNRDGEVDPPFFEAVHPRGDLNGDGTLSRDLLSDVPSLGSRTDLDVLSDKFEDENYTADQLPGLVDSGDVLVDAQACLARPGVSAVRVRVLEYVTQAEVQVRTFDAASGQQVFTLPLGLYDFELRTLDSSGTPGARTLGQLQSVHPGSDQKWDADCVVLTALTPDEGKAGDVLTLDGSGIEPDLALVDVIFENPATDDQLLATITGATLDGSEVKALTIEAPVGVEAISWWKVYVRQGLEQSNQLDFEKSGACITDLHTLGAGTGYDSVAWKVNAAGDVVWTEFPTAAATTGKVYARIAKTVFEIPCMDTATDLNDAGEVTGFLTSGSPLVWSASSPSSCTALPLPSGTTKAGTAFWINASGQLVSNTGWFWEQTTGSPVALQTLQATYDPAWQAHPRGINAAADIVGCAYTDQTLGAVFQQHVALWTAGGATPLDLGFECGTFTGEFFPQAISDSGRILGTAGPDPVNPLPYEIAAELVNGSLVRLGRLNIGLGNASFGLDINDLGQSVGYSEGYLVPLGTTYVSHGVIWLAQPAYASTASGMFRLSDFLDDPAWVVTTARGINASGQIAAEASHNNSNRRAVLVDLGSCVPPQPPSPQCSPTCPSGTCGDNGCGGVCPCPGAQVCKCGGKCMSANSPCPSP
jgi:hypothetical protein